MVTTKQQAIAIFSQVAKEFEGQSVQLSGRGHVKRCTISTPWLSQCAIAAGIQNELVGTGLKSTSRFYAAAVVERFEQLAKSSN